MLSLSLNPHVPVPVPVFIRVPPSHACDIIQARCNDVDNDTMDSSTHTPNITAPLFGWRQKTLHAVSENMELSPWWVFFSLFLSHLPTTPRTRPQIARHIIIVVFNLCAPKEIANTHTHTQPARIVCSTSNVNKTQPAQVESPDTKSTMYSNYIRWIVFLVLGDGRDDDAFSRCW